MAHEIANINGQDCIAFVGEKPWHGLGQELTQSATIETWKKEAGMGYDIVAAPVKFNIEGQADAASFARRNVLYRSDTLAPLSVVSDQYHVVQPGEVLEFFRDLVGAGDMYLETAGVLFGGVRYWAMANTKREAVIGAKDQLRGRLLLTTACDGTQATTAKFVCERVVCNNTLRVALGEKDQVGGVVRRTHGMAFDPKDIKEKLNLIDAGWESFISNVNLLAKATVDDAKVKDFIRSIILNPTQLEQVEREEQLHKRVEQKLAAIFSLYENGMGADMTRGTLWGAVNAITEHVDHHVGKIADNALFNSWYGHGDNLKARAFETALELV